MVQTPVETTAHVHLKRLAAAHLLRLGCRAVATEVQCPISRYRVDAAGYLDPLPVRLRRARRPTPSWAEPLPAGSPRRAERPKTIFIECKQCRSDFLRDGRETSRLLQLLDELDAQRRDLEETRVKPDEPELRCSGSSLFPELEVWDFPSSRNPIYRKLLRRLRRLDEQLYGETKFCMIARYRLADYLYIAAPAGLIEPREVPPGWGLLECSPGHLVECDAALELSSALTDPPDPPPLPLKAAVESPEAVSDARRQSRVLRNIAVAATRSGLERGVRALAGLGPARRNPVGLRGSDPPAPSDGSGFPKESEPSRAADLLPSLSR